MTEMTFWFDPSSPLLLYIQYKDMSLISLAQADHECQYQSNSLFHGIVFQKLLD